MCRMSQIHTPPTTTVIMNRVRLASLSPSLLAAATGCADGPELLLVDDPASAARARAAALDHVHRVAPTASGDVDVVVVRSVFVDDFGGAHVRLQQTEGGAPVLGGEAIVRLDGTGAIVEVQDRLAHDRDVPARPTVSRQGAVDLAVGEVDGADTPSTRASTSSSTASATARPSCGACRWSRWASRPSRRCRLSSSTRKTARATYATTTCSTSP
ncbi:MAG: hypothetical protein FJ137_05440 [Deltaproteobacteria bacterium]|nr:hypothetical protein [Deltaproteobacteria bacterium]